MQVATQSMGHGPRLYLSALLAQAQKQQLPLPSGAPGDAGQQASGSELLASRAVALAAEQAAMAEEETLITPSNAEAPAPQAAAAGPLPAQCIFCGGLGTEGNCGPLQRVTVDGQHAAVHHLCAIWSPGCYLPEGSSTYVNLEAEARRAKGRHCSGCGQTGAPVPCASPWCRSAYHLPCAMGAPGVVLDAETFELWCPAHADHEGAASDEDYNAAPTPARPRRQPGSGTGSGKRLRASSESQRPRTDWQKKDENTWFKVVPPWWCEQRTVHFATKVYKELFRSAGSAILVDPSGGEWLCLVQTEARNDNRPQYTLRGAFADLWQAQGISSGDTLIFKRDPLTGQIELNRHAAGSGAAAGARMEEAAGSDMTEPFSVFQQPEASGGGGAVAGGGRSRIRQEASSEPYARGQSQQGSHPNRWMELADGWAIKTVYKSTLAHQQCPIAGWLFKKLYGRLPADTDRAPVYDPDLDAEYRFDVSFVSAANVHYVTGRTFSAWVRESGLQAGEQIRMRKDTAGRVVIQRVPTEKKVRVDFTTKAASRTASVVNMSGAAVAGAPAAHGQELASPPTAEALEALEALVAAAGYAGAHGTPAIQAALAAGAGNLVLGGTAGAAAAAAAAGMGMGLELGALQAGGAAAAAGALPEPKRRRMADQAEGGAAAEVLLAQQEQAVLAARRVGGGGAGSALAGVPTGFTLADWQPSSPHMLMFSAINDILAAQEWSPQEQAELLRFRAKYAWLDSCGREVAYLTISQAKNNKPALLEFLRAAGQGILTQLPSNTAVSVQVPAHTAARVSPFAAAAAAAGTPVAVQPQQQRQQLEQQQQAGEALGGISGLVAVPLVAASLELPREEAGLELGLEGAASFNLDCHDHYFGSAACAIKAEQEQEATAM